MTQFQMNDQFIQNQNFKMQFQMKINKLKAQVEIHKRNTQAYKLRLSALNQTRSQITDQVEALTKDYQKKLQNLQSKVSKLQTQNKQLNKKNTIYKTQIDSFKLRLIQKQKLISSIISQKQFAFTKQNNNLKNNQYNQDYKELKQQFDKKNYLLDGVIQIKKQESLYLSKQSYELSKQKIATNNQNLQIHEVIKNDQKQIKNHHRAMPPPPPPSGTSKKRNLNKRHKQQRQQQLQNFNKSSENSNDNLDNNCVQQPSSSQVNQQQQCQRQQPAFNQPKTTLDSMFCQPKDYLNSKINIKINQNNININIKQSQQNKQAQQNAQFTLEVKKHAQFTSEVQKHEQVRPVQINLVQTKQQQMQEHLNESHLKKKYQNNLCQAQNNEDNFKDNYDQLKIKSIPPPPPPPAKKKQIKTDLKNARNKVFTNFPSNTNQNTKKQQNQFNWNNLAPQNEHKENLNGKIREFVNQNNVQSYQKQNCEQILPQNRNMNVEIKVQDPSSAFLNNFQSTNVNFNFETLDNQGENNGFEQQSNLNHNCNQFDGNQFNQQINKEEQVYYNQDQQQQAKLSGADLFFNSLGNSHTYTQQSSIQHVEHEDTSMISNMNMVNMLAEYNQIRQGPSQKKMTKKKAKRQKISVLDPNSFV